MTYLRREMSEERGEDGVGKRKRTGRCGEEGGFLFRF
jgi:hypothetical protein